MIKAISIITTATDPSPCQFHNSNIFQPQKQKQSTVWFILLAGFAMYVLRMTTSKKNRWFTIPLTR